MDKKIRKAIKESLQPSKTFNDFCEENDILVSKTIVRKDKKKKRALWTFASLAATAVAVILCCIPFFPHTVTDPKLYGDTEVTSERIILEDLEKVEGLYVLDSVNIAQYGIISKISPIESPQLTLAYSIQDILYGFQEEIDFYAFQIEYLARCYKGYNFTGINEFSNLNHTGTTERAKYQFKILNSVNQIAYIAFKIDDFEYFFTVKAFEDITEINVQNIEILIAKLLT